MNEKPLWKGNGHFFLPSLFATTLLSVVLLIFLTDNFSTVLIPLRKIKKLPLLLIPLLQLLGYFRNLKKHHVLFLQVISFFQAARFHGVWNWRKISHLNFHAKPMLHLFVQPIFEYSHQKWSKLLLHKHILMFNFSAKNQTSLCNSEKVCS